MDKHREYQKIENYNYTGRIGLYMKTSVPDSLAPGLTDKQLESLYLLMDGNWHDHAEISRKTRTFIPANISGRIVRPLEDRGIVEQEERPIKNGSKKTKKFVRIRPDIDAHMLHLLIEYSANDLIIKHGRKKQPEKAKFVLTIRNDSIKQLVELEEQEKERLRKAKEEYWKNKKSAIPYSESWPELIDAAEKIAYHFERALNPRDELTQPPLRDIIEKIPSIAFLAASAANPKLSKKVSQECKRYEWNKYYGMDIDEWNSAK